jgi:hypothetical protein
LVSFGVCRHICTKSWSNSPHSMTKLQTTATRREHLGCSFSASLDVPHHRDHPSPPNFGLLRPVYPPRFSTLFIIQTWDASPPGCHRMQQSLNGDSFIRFPGSAVG